MTARRLGALLAAGALACAGAAAGSPAATAAPAKAKRCDIAGREQQLGARAVSSLTVTGVSCAEGEKVVRAFHACRLANGPSGRCVRRVRGFACGEQRTGVPPQFSARVSCSKDRKSVRHSYSQTG